MTHRELVLGLFLWGILAVNGESTEPFGLRLVGGDSWCRGKLQVQRSGQDWTGVKLEDKPQLGNRVCAELDCGPLLTMGGKRDSEREVLGMRPCNDTTSLSHCFQSETHRSNHSLELSCSDSVRLVGGQSLCSGSLQIRDQSLKQSWTDVCDGALDRRGAEVLCRELDCGAPLLQGALSPLGQMFHCEGNESALMDCPWTTTRPETCSTLNLTCSEPLRLVGGTSRCEGTVEVKQSGDWRTVEPLPNPWDLEAASVVCRSLDCGSSVSTVKKERRSWTDNLRVWTVESDCMKKRSAVKQCIATGYSGSGVVVVCTELLKVPEVSVSEGVWAPRAQGGVRVLTGGDFRVTCSVEPQYPGGSFQLLSPTLNHTLPAVNHSAHFLFTDAGSAHSGSYTCIYHLQAFNHSFSSNSSLHISAGVTSSYLLLRALVMLLLQLLNFIPYFYYRRQATRERQGTRRARRHRAPPEEERTDVTFNQM